VTEILEFLDEGCNDLVIPQINCGKKLGMKLSLWLISVFRKEPGNIDEIARFMPSPGPCQPRQDGLTDMCRIILVTKMHRISSPSDKFQIWIV
jgi:hypothetical protein